MAQTLLRAPAGAQTTDEFTEALLARLRADLWLAVREVTVTGGGMRADVLAMRRTFNPSPMVIFEVKTSRNDLLGDLRREKWRGYLTVAAVVFAFPRGLAEPHEIPKEAGVFIRASNAGPFRWHRGPRLSQAPKPSDYLHRRMSMSAHDQARRLITDRSASLYTAARAERQANGRRLAQIAEDIDLYENTIVGLKETHGRLYEEIRHMRDVLRNLEVQKNRALELPLIQRGMA